MKRFQNPRKLNFTKNLRFYVGFITVNISPKVISAILFGVAFK